MNEPKVTSAIRADWDRQTATMADWEAYWAHEAAKLKRNDLTPTTMREWQQRGPDRRQAERRTAEANYTFHNALTETRLTWPDVREALQHIGIVIILALALAGAWQVWKWL